MLKSALLLLVSMVSLNSFAQNASESHRLMINADRIENREDHTVILRNPRLHVDGEYYSLSDDYRTANIVCRAFHYTRHSHLESDQYRAQYSKRLKIVEGHVEMLPQTLALAAVMKEVTCIEPIVPIESQD